MEASQDIYTPPQGQLIEQSGEFNTPRFFALNGRIGRLRYLAYSCGLNALIYVVILLLIGGIAANSQLLIWFSSVAVLLMLPLLVYSWGFMVRRLNDLDRSGWLSLIMLIPLINFFFGLYLLFARGTEGSNRYGAPPPKNGGGVILLALIMPAIFFIGVIAAIALPAYQQYVERAQAAQLGTGN